MMDGEPSFARLNQVFDGVGKFASDVQTQRRFFGIRPKTAWRIGNIGFRGCPHHPTTEALQHFLLARKVIHRRRLAVANYNIGLPSHNRLYQIGNGCTRILMIAISVDNNIRAQLQGCINAGLKRRWQSAPSTMPHNVVNTHVSRYLDRAICRAIINHQRFITHLGGADRHIAQHVGQCFFLIQTRNLNNHAPRLLALLGAGWSNQSSVHGVPSREAMGDER